MDYPQLNLLFGLCLIIAVVVNVGLRILLSKVQLPAWISILSRIALILSILMTLYMEYLFLLLMNPAFNWQIGFGWLVIGGIGAKITASLYQRLSSSRLATFMFSMQMIASLISLVLAFGLYHSLVPISPP